MPQAIESSMPRSVADNLEKTLTMARNGMNFHAACKECSKLPGGRTPGGSGMPRERMRMRQRRRRRAAAAAAATTAAAAAASGGSGDGASENNGRQLIRLRNKNLCQSHVLQHSSMHAPER